MMLFFHGLAIKQAYFRHQRQDALFLQPIPYTEKVSSGAGVHKDVGVQVPHPHQVKELKSFDFSYFSILSTVFSFAM